MDLLELTFKTFGGNNINDTTNYIQKGVPVNTPVLAKSSPEYAQRADNFPVDSGVNLAGRQLPLQIAITGGSLSELTKWFDTSSRTTSVLVATDGSAVDWYVNARAVDFTMKNVGQQPTALIILYIADPVWKKVTASTDTWSITASGQTRNISVSGNKFARPVFTIGPTSARTGGFGYKRFIAISNRTTEAYNGPLNMLDANLDTAALVTATKMQADGDDVRIFNDATGAEEFRWFGGGGINTTTTRIFSNVNLPPQIKMTTGASISGSGAVATITIAVNKDNLAALKMLSEQSYKFVSIDAGTANYEVYSYTGVSIGKTSYTIIGCTRAQKGTTDQAHSSGATVRHLTGFYLMYGNSALTAPTTDDSQKPIIDLVSSTNTSHVYADFYDALNPLRTAMWKPQVIKNVGEKSEIYTATEYTQADVASVMGGAVKMYYAGTAPRSPSATLVWELYNPATYTTLTWTGKKYRYSTDWTATMAVKKSTGSKFVVVANEATPSALQTWEALSTHSSVALGTGNKIIRLEISGTVKAVADNMCALEIGYLTAVLESTLVPLISLGSEATNNYEEFRITNTVDSAVQGWIEVSQQIPVNTTITIDTENLEAYTADGSPVKISLDDESRAEWLPFVPNKTNVLTYTETGANAVTLTTVWRDRNL